MDRTDLSDGDVDLAGSIDAHISLKIDLAPNSNPQLIAGSQDVIRRHRGQVEWGEGRRNVLKEIGAEDREDLSSRGRGEFLELCQRLRRELAVLGLIALRRLPVLRFGVRIGSGLNLRLQISRGSGAARESETNVSAFLRLA